MLVTFGACQYWHHPGDKVIAQLLRQREHYAGKLGAIDCLSMLCGIFFCLMLYPLMGAVATHGFGLLGGIAVWFGLSLVTILVTMAAYMYYRRKLDSVNAKIDFVMQEGTLVDTLSDAFGLLGAALNVYVYERRLNRVLTNTSHNVQDILTDYLTAYHANGPSGSRQALAINHARQIDDALVAEAEQARKGHEIMQALASF